MPAAALVFTVVLVLGVAGCSGIEWVSGDGGEAMDTVIARPTDPHKLRLLGGLPPSETTRGVYVVDLDAAGELSPGSRLAPIVRPYVEAGAELLVETAVPPITLLSGVSETLDIPDEAIRVGDVVIFGEPGLAEQAAERLRDGEKPAHALVPLADSDVPVTWVGPTPAPQGTGRTVVTATPEQVSFTVDLGDADAQDALSHVVGELADGGPPGSPGKPWSTIFGQPKVVRAGNILTMTAAPLDLPGLFLRALLDQQQATFLPTSSD